MKTNNTISIHYIVQTQYVENENGEKVIFKKKFELENIPLARKNALDYYHTGLDYQHEEKEICTKKNGQIIYKHPENYDRGYAFYISICENEKSVLHLLDAHYDLDIAEQKKVNAGRSLEKKLYRQMNLQFERNTYLNLMMSKYTTVQINLIDQLKSLSRKEIEYIPYDCSSSVDDVLEAICAFLNTGNGYIVLGQDEDFNVEDNPDFSLSISRLKQHIAEHFNPFLHLIMIKIAKIDQKEFILISIDKALSDVYIKDEYYFRNQFGNVLDLDK